jgi:hypothetical protein
MKPGETMNKLISHITDTMVIIREIYADYGEKVLTPQIDINGGISSATFRKFITDHTANMMNFFKMNLFWAALTPELQGVIAQKDQEDMTIKKMYRIATTAQLEAKDTRKPAATNEVSTEDVDNEQDETDVAAFQDCQNTQGARPKNTGASFQNNTNKNFQNQSRGGQQNYSNSRRSGLGNNIR